MRRFASKYTFFFFLGLYFYFVGKKNAVMEELLLLYSLIWKVEQKRQVTKHEKKNPETSDDGICQQKQNKTKNQEAALVTYI